MRSMLTLSGDVRQPNRARADHLHRRPPVQFADVGSQSDWESVMKRNKRWLARWGSFLMGICIGLLIVTPVLAMPQSGLLSLLLLLDERRDLTLHLRKELL